MKNIRDQDVRNMTKKDLAQKSASHTIDLTKIDGDGSFQCPKCGTVISPEDESEEIYKIVNTKIVNDELIGLIVMCVNCGSTIKLTGFQQTIEGLTNK